MKRMVTGFLVVCMMMGVFSGCAKQSPTADAVATKPQAAPMDQKSADVAESAPNQAQATDKMGVPVPTESGFLPGAEEKLIYSGHLSVETLDYEKAVQGLLTLVSSLNGFTENSDFSNNGGYAPDGTIRAGRRTARYVLRIPQKNFDGFFTAAGQIGAVKNSGTAVENITAQYHDSNLRLNSLTVQHERLITLLKEAEKLEDTLAIENRLAEIRWQMDSLQSQLKNWDTDVEYSTITVELYEVKEYSKGENDSLLRRFIRTFHDSWSNYGNWVVAFGQFLLMLLPFALTGIALYAVARKPLKRLWSKRIHKKDDKNK